MKPFVSSKNLLNDQWQYRNDDVCFYRFFSFSNVSHCLLFDISFLFVLVGWLMHIVILFRGFYGLFEKKRLIKYNILHGIPLRAHTAHTNFFGFSFV